MGRQESIISQKVAEPQAAAEGTVGKALHVLDRVAAFDRPVRFTELLSDSPYPKATLYRLMQTLVEQNMLTYDVDRQTYAVGLRLVRLAHSAWQHASLAPIARPYIEALRDDVGLTVHLAQLDGYQVLYIDKCSVDVGVRMYSATGKVGPGYCTGIGKAMLAFLPEDAQARAVANQTYVAHTPTTVTSIEELMADLKTIAKTGVSFDREEHEPGIICLGVPILSSERRVVGGVSVTTTTNKQTLKDLENLAPRVQQAAQEIARAFEAWTFPHKA